MKKLVFATILLLLSTQLSFADKRVTDLTAQTEAISASDYIPGIDVSDTTENAAGSSKKITWTQVGSYLATLFPTHATSDGNYYASKDGTWASLTGVFLTPSGNTTGTAGGLAAQYIDWSATTGGTSIANKPVLTKDIGWVIKESDVATAVADGKMAFAVPATMNGMNLTDCTAAVADLNSAASGATTVVLRRVRGVTAADMTSTGVTIEYNIYSASDETVDTANDDLATGDLLYPDVNAVTSAAQKGLSFTCIFSLP